MAPDGEVGAAHSVYFALIVALLLNSPVVVANYSEYGSYSGVAAQIAVAAGIDHLCRQCQRPGRTASIIWASACS
jgi:hypothetical protein